MPGSIDLVINTFQNGRKALVGTTTGKTSEICAIVSNVALW